MPLDEIKTGTETTTLEELFTHYIDDIDALGFLKMAEKVREDVEDSTSSKSHDIPPPPPFGGAGVPSAIETEDTFVRLRLKGAPSEPASVDEVIYDDSSEHALG